jgi:hypothetical protein
VGDHLGIPPVVCFWFLLSLRFPTFLSTEAHQEALLLPAPTPDFFCSAAYPPPFAFFCHEPPDVNEAPRRQYHDDLELEGRQHRQDHPDAIAHGIPGLSAGRKRTDTRPPVAVYITCDRLENLGQDETMRDVSRTVYASTCCHDSRVWITPLQCRASGLQG